jgi:sialate O-acetylesterase
MKCTVVAGFLISLVSGEHAEHAGEHAAPFAFSRTLGSSAVLRNPIVLWGTGAAGDSVTTSVSGGPPLAAVTIGADGVWRQPLPSQAEGFSTFNVTSTSGGSTISLHDLLAGETILCSGQSNLDLVVMSKVFNSTAEVAACGNYPHIRLARPVRYNSWDGPQTDLPVPLQQPWAAPTPDNCKAFSATCFFAARDLFESLGGKTPVGVVMSSAGGTGVRNWVPAEGLADCSQPWSGEMQYGPG